MSDVIASTLKAHIKNYNYIPTLKLYFRMTVLYMGFTFWIVVWIPIGMVLTILTIISNDEKRYYNCSSWALRQWAEKGGYIAIRWLRSPRERWISWPHFLWVSDEDEGCMQHYTDPHPNKGPIPKIYYLDGVVKRGDNVRDNHDS